MKTHKKDQAPTISDPLNVKRIEKLQKRLLWICASTLISIFILSIFDEVEGLSELTYKLLIDAQVLLAFPFAISAFALMFSANYQVQELGGKELEEMIEIVKYDNQLLYFAGKIKDQGRSPVTDDLTSARKYKQLKQNYEANKEATARWDSLKTPQVVELDLGFPE